jgi:uncharacterized protein with HEPN domain
MWLLDILEAIDKIEKYASAGETAFFKEELIQVWIIHYLQIIGEAANHLSAEIRMRHIEIPWAKIVAMRNVMVHHYFGIDLKEVWNTVCIDLPDLKAKMTELLAEFPLDS